MTDPRYEFVDHRTPPYQGPTILTGQESVLVRVLLRATVQLLEKHSDAPEAQKLHAFVPQMKDLLIKLGGAQP